MTGEELDRLAALIAAELRRTTEPPRASWVPSPVRHQPTPPPADPPPWAASAQRLGDLAPIRAPEPSSHRDDVAAATRAVRAAAAGHPESSPRRAPMTSSRLVPTIRSVARGGAVVVPIGVSNRHVHLSTADCGTLFGVTTLDQHRPLAQPGQFAATQRVTVIGPGGRIDGVRVVGPARGATQVELALSDAAMLGVTPMVANSGKLDGSGGDLVLEGPSGRVTLARGVIIAARHLHLAPDDARAWRLGDGDLVTLRCGDGARETTWQGVLVRSGAAHATEFHLDVDEARAAAVRSGDSATLVARTPAVGTRRPLVTERDVIAAASRNEPLPTRAILTPSARDRAAALGMLPE